MSDLAMHPKMLSSRAYASEFVMQKADRVPSMTVSHRANDKPCLHCVTNVQRSVGSATGAALRWHRCRRRLDGSGWVGAHIDVTNWRRES